jgi:hypothetical protein
VNNDPTSYPEREQITLLIRAISQALLHRGSLLKSDLERKAIEHVVSIEGGGGYRSTPEDSAGTKYLIRI